MKRHIPTLLLAPLILSLSTASNANDCREAGQAFKEARNAQSIDSRINYLDRSIELCPTFEAWYVKGRTYQETKQYTKAKQAFVNSKKYANNDKSIALSLARTAEVMAEEDNTWEAMSLLHQAMKMLNPAPEWMSALLAKLDNQDENTVIPADKISTAINEVNSEASRSFGVSPTIHLRVNFAYDSAELKANGKKQVDELAKALSRYTDKGYEFKLIGHTDSRGSASYNMALSQRRAEAVKRAIQHKNSQLASKICTEGKGETELLYPGNTDKDHRGNRRVEIKLVKSCS
jgi:outer membrane protein OmpA-like peptidoglycan-associated protein